MATVYAPPLYIPVPEFNVHDIAAYERAVDDFIAKLAERAKVEHPHPLVGEVVRFPKADGYAQYLVWSARPLQLVHLPIGDAWQISAAEARGLRLSDIEQKVNQRRSLKAIFAGRG